MKKPKPVCTGDCTKREAGCHSTCEEYIAWRKALDDWTHCIAEKKHDDSIRTQYITAKKLREGRR